MSGKLDTSIGIVDNIFRNNKGSTGVCIYQDGKEYTFEDLLNRIKAAKIFFSEYPKGTHFGILSENNINFSAMWLASMHSGMVMIPLNTSETKSELDYMIKDGDVEVLLKSEKFGDEYSVKSFLISSIIKDNLENAKGLECKPSEVDLDGLAVIMHTSGTTGKPTGVQLTHRNIIANTDSIINYIKPTDKDRIMLVLPFYHCFGMSIQNMMFTVGGEVVINNRFAFPQKVAEEIVEKKCTIFAGVPTTYSMLLRMTRIAEMDTSHLRLIYSSGGKIPDKDLIGLKKALPHTEIYNSYGLTEASPRLSYLPFEYYDSKLGSIGLPLTGVELRVVNGNGKQVNPGETGEIIAKGENISPGYWKNPEKTKETFRDGWLYTGDLAKVDEDGFIYIEGRRKDFVKVAGHRFALADIENVVNSMDGVRESAAVMVPDEILGEAIILFIAPESDKVTEDGVMGYCREKLSSFKIPRKVKIIEQIPKNSFGKIQKRKLIEPGGEGLYLTYGGG